MTGNQLALILGGFTLLTSIVPPLQAADAPPPHQDLAMRTISDLRSVGTAMFHWWKDEMSARRSPEAHKKAEAFNEEAAKTTVSVDLGTIPKVSRDDLAKLLVPKYIPSIPEKDGWGNPYEFRLQTANPELVHQMAVRSAGKDGAFSGDSYRIEGFPARDEAQDLAWMDGYFIRWPEAGKEPGN